MTTPTSTPPDTIIRLPEVMRLVGLSRASIYRRMKQGTFPQQIQLSNSASRGGAVGWSLTEILAWIEANKNSRSAA